LGNTAARERQKTKDNTSAIAKVWQDTWADAYPDDPLVAPLVREVAALRTALTKRVPVYDHRRPFVEWSIKNWRDVVKTKFAWMNKGGSLDLPRMGFLVSKIADFYASYIDSIDPNRAVDRRIRETVQTEEQKRIALLEKQVTMLKQERDTALAGSGANGSYAKATAAVAKRKAIRRITLKRTKSDEFGEWGDRD